MGHAEETMVRKKPQNSFENRDEKSNRHYHEMPDACSAEDIDESGEPL